LEKEASSFLRKCGYADEVRSFMHAKKLCTRDEGIDASLSNVCNELKYWVATCKSTTAGDRQKMKQLEDAYEKKKAESNAKKSRCHVKVVFDLRKEKVCHRGTNCLTEKRVGPTSSLGIIAGDCIPDEYSPATIPQRHVAGETFPQRHVAGENPEMSLGKTPIVVVLKLIKTGLQAMVISEEWSSYRDDDTVKANFVKEKIVNDEWWDKVSYILSFTGPIYEMIRACDTDKPCLHLVYEMWDSMIEKVKIEIYKKEKRSTSQKSLFYDVVHGILVARWAKNNTPLHCLAHSLNPRFYSDAWLLEDSTRSAPHRDAEISQERMKCFRRLFPNDDEHSRVLDEYAMFSMKSGCFSDLTSISMMGTMEPKSWWVNFGAQTPFLQTLAFRLLGQPSSSSCAERNWSTYAFIHSLRRNKLTTSRAQDLVYIHNNLRLLSRNPNDDVKMWDVGGDAFDSMEDVGFLEFADLSLDEPEFENDLIIDN
ncbi:hAT dimerization domain, ribonuclease H-like domain protein, partial [Tanacetum coccineum]